MDLIELFALVFFLAAAVVAGIQRSWTIVLIAAGLFLVTLAGTGLVDS